MYETYVKIAEELKNEIQNLNNPNIKELKKMFENIYNKLPKFYQKKVGKIIWRQP